MPMLRTAFTDLLGVDLPIAGFNRSPAVVAAVCNAGGLGVLAASGYRPDELDAQLTWIEEQTGGRPYGVDLLIPEKFAAGDPGNLVTSLRAQIPDEHLAFVRGLLDRYGVPPRPAPPGRAAAGDRAEEFWASVSPAGAESLLDAAFSHRIALIASALGTPPPDLVARGKAAGVVVAALVGAPKHAERQLAAGVDLLIAQGTEAGGHTGTIATMVLTPEVVALAGSRPVLAAGGIASGAQMAAALALGAAGVWCGSVWLSSHEDVANQAIKAKFLAATSADTVARGRAPASPPASCAAPGSTSGSGPAARTRCPCRCSRCWSATRGRVSTRPPTPGTRARWRWSRSSSARSSARSASSARPPRSPASWPPTASSASPAWPG